MEHAPGREAKTIHWLLRYDPRGGQFEHGPNHRLEGDIFILDVYESSLPFSTLYPPPQGVHAEREGDQVVVSWRPVWMTEDDYRGYLIEAWVCQGGELVFSPTRWDQNLAFIPDEAGCGEPSHGRLYTVEKHGYTRWVAIPWPDPAAAAPSD